MRRHQKSISRKIRQKFALLLVLTLTLSLTMGNAQVSKAAELGEEDQISFVEPEEAVAETVELVEEQSVVEEVVEQIIEQSDEGSTAEEDILQQQEEPVNTQEEQQQSGEDTTLMQENVQQQTPYESMTQETEEDLEEALDEEEEGLEEELEEDLEEELEEEEIEEEILMPAQSFSGSAGSVRVSASAKEGVFPEGTSMNVAPVSAGYIINAADGIAGNNEEVVDAVAVDITFKDKEGREIQPQDGSVHVSLYSSHAVDGESHELIHVDGSGNAHSIGGASATSASFNADHFSIYAIIGTDGKQDNDIARYTYIFMIDGYEISRQIVKSGDILLNPGTPDTPSHSVFKGWQIEGETSFIDFSQIVVIGDDDEDKEFIVNPVFETFYSVYFYKDAYKTSLLKVVNVQSGETVRTDNVRYDFKNGRVIVGWKQDDTGAEVNQVTVSDKDIHLLPVIKSVISVVFNTKGGSLIDTAYVETGEAVPKPEDPTRSGFTFKGWYLDDTYRVEYDFNESLFSNLTLYAKWTADKQVQYEVIHYLQNANDSGYTEEFAEIMDGNPSDEATYTPQNFDGFELNTQKTDSSYVTIKEDGTTKKNVYYDRKTYPMRFYVKNNSGEWELVRERSFKLGQDTSSIWNQVTSYYSGYIWKNTSNNSGMVYVSAPIMMQIPYGTSYVFDGLNAYGFEGETEATIRYVDEDTGEEIHKPFIVGVENLDWSMFYVIEIPGYTNHGHTEFVTYQDGDKTVNEMYVNYFKNTYTVIFIDEEKMFNKSDNGVEYKAPLADYEPDGYEVGVTTTDVQGVTKVFAGWYDNRAYQGSPINIATATMPGLDVTMNYGSPYDDKAEYMLFAKWALDEYTVSFDLGGGTFDGKTSIADQIVEAGNYATEPNNSLLEKEDFTFACWLDKETGNEFDFSTAINKDVELIASWNRSTELRFMIKFAPAEGLIRDPYYPYESYTYYCDGEEASVANPMVADDCIFVGFRVGESDVIVSNGYFTIKEEDAVISDDGIGIITLTPVINIRQPQTYIIYHPNGGNGSVYVTDAFNNNEEHITLDPKDIGITPKPGYKFVGWTTDKEGGGVFYNPGRSISADYTTGNLLYAQWAIDEDKCYVVTYEAGTGGSVLNESDGPFQVFNTGDITGSVAWAEEGYVFDSWYKGDVSVGDYPYLAAKTVVAHLNKDGDGLHADTYFTAQFRVDENATKSATYTVKHVTVLDGVETEKDSADTTVEVWVNDAFTIQVGTLDQKSYDGYKYDSIDPAGTAVGSEFADGDVITLKYVKDEEQTKSATYTVKHVTVLDGVETEKDSADTTVEVWVNDAFTIQVGTLDQNSYDGYKYDSIDPAGTAVGSEFADGDVITLKYVKDYQQTQGTKYTVQHVVEGDIRDTQDYEGKAWINDDPAMITIWDGSLAEKTYTGYKLDEINPNVSEGDEVESGTVITLTYVKDFSQYFDVIYSWTGEPDGEYEQELPEGETDILIGESYQIDTKYVEGFTVDKKDSQGNVIGTWTFSGWSTDDATIENGIILGVENDITLTGEWTYEEKEKLIVTITVDSISKVYGNDEPEYTASVEGLRSGDTISYELSRERYTGENGQDLENDWNRLEGVGSHGIMVDGIGILSPDGEDVTDMYEINVVNGQLTITPRPITITADSASKTYDGTALTCSTYKITSGSLASGETITSIKISGSQTAVGSSANKVVSVEIHKNPDTTGNYVISYADGSLSVTPAGGSGGGGGGTPTPPTPYVPPVKPVVPQYPVVPTYPITPASGINRDEMATPTVIDVRTIDGKVTDAERDYPTGDVNMIRNIMLLIAALVGLVSMVSKKLRERL